jgi:hypothetical protein
MLVFSTSAFTELNPRALVPSAKTQSTRLMNEALETVEMVYGKWLMMTTPGLQRVPPLKNSQDPKGNYFPE